MSVYGEMNNKEIGTEFENDMVDFLASQGFWAHFISPDKRGAQPFDIIAVKDGEAFAIDCKTCSTKFLRYDRLEDNQITAFEKWIDCGNSMPRIAARYKETIYMIRYDRLKKEGRINLEKEPVQVFGLFELSV